MFKTDIYIALKTAPIPIFYAEDCMHAALEKAAWRVTDIYFFCMLYIRLTNRLKNICMLTDIYMLNSIYALSIYTAWSMEFFYDCWCIHAASVYILLNLWSYLRNQESLCKL